eukprot:11940218-Karenia_brevis.AAC.1
MSKAPASHGAMARGANPLTRTFVKLHTLRYAGSVHPRDQPTCSNPKGTQIRTSKGAKILLGTME